MHAEVWEGLFFTMWPRLPGHSWFHQEWVPKQKHVSSGWQAAYEVAGLTFVQ